MDSHAVEQAIRELVTARDFVRWGASRFNEAGLVFGHGTDNAWDEAGYLVRHALHLPPETPDECLAARLVTAEREAVAELLRRRVVERKPAAYLTHRAWFCGLEFYVDERVLIPRSPMAELVEQGFEPWLDASSVTRVLDLGTGSGCIAIACAFAFPEARVDAADVDPGALAVAERNVADYGLEDRVRVVRSDVFDALGGESYDLIVANPPYVSEAEVAALPDEYHHEPYAGLAAGSEGLDYALRILREAPQHLTADGLLALEVGESEDALMARCPEVPFVWASLERGGTGICLMGREQLIEYADAF